MVGSICEAGRTLNYPLPMSGLGGVGWGGFGFGGVGLGLEAPNTRWEYWGGQRWLWRRLVVQDDKHFFLNTTYP